LEYFEKTEQQRERTKSQIIATSAVAIHDFGVFSSIVAQGYCQSNL
jgi:hypothetical protein